MLSTCFLRSDSKASRNLVSKLLPIRCLKKAMSLPAPSNALIPRRSTNSPSAVEESFASNCVFPALSPAMRYSTSDKPRKASSMSPLLTCSSQRVTASTTSRSCCTASPSFRIFSRRLRIATIFKPPIAMFRSKLARSSLSSLILETEAEASTCSS